MCGILVVLSKKEPIDPSRCGRALATLNWRGPDIGHHSVWEDRLFLGQTVLSITGDPREGVGEYHRSDSGRYEVYFNGEIYNFRELADRYLVHQNGLPLRYGTDTEVLASLHEVMAPDLVPPLLDGMYAYVLFDRKTKQLKLFRDIQGEKSLYFYEDDGQVIISSEIRTILSLVPGLSADSQALRDYFHTRHLMLFGRTVYSRIREILPGNRYTLDLNSYQWSQKSILNLKQWVDPKRMEDNARRSVDSLVDELDELFERAVFEMIPSERKYASVVSGGIDSSLISHYVVKRGNPQLLIAVNHIGKDKISCDLSGFEKILGRSIDILQVDAPSYIAEISRCQKACGHPLPAHSFVAQALQADHVRSQGCRVMFGGEGADELFGGYSAYLTPQVPSGRFSPSPYTGYQNPVVGFDENYPELIENDLAFAWKDALDVYEFVNDPYDRTALAMMYCDTAYQLPAVGLRCADLMSMMWSIETRSVFLRRALIQFALNLPVTLKANRQEETPLLLRTKQLLKRLFLRHYPSELLVEKQGFAGFPNEAARYLGNPLDYLAIGRLKIRRDSLPIGLFNRSCEWKLINTEYYLRQV